MMIKLILLDIIYLFMEQKTDLKVVIFDMDGTLIDSERLHKLVQSDVLAKFGVKFLDDDYVEFVGKRASELWEFLKEKYNLAPSVDELISMNRKEYYEFLKRKEGVFLMDGVFDFIIDLKKRGLFLAIGTSASRRTLDLVLDVFNLRNVFDFSVTADDVKFGKPNPEVFLKIVDYFGVSPDNCVGFEDALHGIESAHNAGIKCIAFSNHGNNLQDISGADFILDDYESFSFEKLIEVIN